MCYNGGPRTIKPAGISIIPHLRTFCQVKFSIQIAQKTDYFLLFPGNRPAKRSHILSTYPQVFSTASGIVFHRISSYTPSYPLYPHFFWVKNVISKTCQEETCVLWKVPIWLFSIVYDYFTISLFRKQADYAIIQASKTCRFGGRSEAV